MIWQPEVSDDTENFSNTAVTLMKSEHSAAWLSDTIISVAAATSTRRELQSLRRLLTFSVGFCNLASWTSDDQYRRFLMSAWTSPSRHGMRSSRGTGSIYQACVRV